MNKRNAVVGLLLVVLLMGIYSFSNGFIENKERIFIGNDNILQTQSVMTSEEFTLEISSKDQQMYNDKLYFSIKLGNRSLGGVMYYDEVRKRYWSKGIHSFGKDVLRKKEIILHYGKTNKKADTIILIHE